MGSVCSDGLVRLAAWWSVCHGNVMGCSGEPAYLEDIMAPELYELLV